MVEYVTTDRCLMELLRKELDDPGAEPCGRCSNCTGEHSSTEVDGTLIRKALASFRADTIEILPRKQLPCDLGGEVDLRQHAVEVGRCLTRWGDPGLARKVQTGKYQDDRFDDELEEAMLELIEGWRPEPSPTWITWVPSSSGSMLVADFAARLADRLGLPVVESLVRVEERPRQKTMENSCQQARNVVGAFDVVLVQEGPVFLIDDMVDSRWTFTVLGSQLRSKGAGEVYPVALADTSQSGE
jgi:ATP-dependent DNA helicase RecQ